jgi:hypothetical protein
MAIPIRPCADSWRRRCRPTSAATQASPVDAVFVRGSYDPYRGPSSWYTAYVGRSTGKLRAIFGSDRLREVVPVRAGPIHFLPAPPPWASGCAVKALTTSQRAFASRIGKARRQVGSAGTSAGRRRALLLLRRLQAQVGAYTNLIGARTC